MAVWFVVLLLEGALVELLEAEGTDKMLRMELLAHGRDAPACYGLLAAGAERATPLMVVNLTVRLPIMLKETAIHKRGKTLLQYTHRKQKSCKNSVLLFYINNSDYGVVSLSFMHKIYFTFQSRHIPYKQSTQGARGCSGQIYNFPVWPGHSHHTWEQKGQSNLYGNTPSHLSHENLKNTHSERPQHCCKLNTVAYRGEYCTSSSFLPSGPKKAPH